MYLRHLLYNCAEHIAHCRRKTCLRSCTRFVFQSRSLACHTCCKQPAVTPLKRHKRLHQISNFKHVFDSHAQPANLNPDTSFVTDHDSDMPRRSPDAQDRMAVVSHDRSVLHSPWRRNAASTTSVLVPCLRFSCCHTRTTTGSSRCVSYALCVASVNSNEKSFMMLQPRTWRSAAIYWQTQLYTTLAWTWQSSVQPCCSYMPAQTATAGVLNSSARHRSASTYSLLMGWLKLVIHLLTAVPAPAAPFQPFVQLALSSKLCLSTALYRKCSNLDTSLSTNPGVAMSAIVTGLA